MAKCIALWFGDDSSGRSIEVAKSIAGTYFSRVYEFNGFHKAWTKWTKMDEQEIIHPTKFRNKYDNKVYYYNEDKTPYLNIVEWGFCNLRGGDIDGCRYRLPNL